MVAAPHPDTGSWQTRRARWGCRCLRVRSRARATAGGGRRRGGPGTSGQRRDRLDRATGRRDAPRCSGCDRQRSRASGRLMNRLERQAAADNPGPCRIRGYLRGMFTKCHSPVCVLLSRYDLPRLRRRQVLPPLRSQSTFCLATDVNRFSATSGDESVALRPPRLQAARRERRDDGCGNGCLKHRPCSDAHCSCGGSYVKYAQATSWKGQPR